MMTYLLFLFSTVAYVKIFGIIVILLMLLSILLQSRDNKGSNLSFDSNVLLHWFWFKGSLISKERVGHPEYNYANWYLQCDSGILFKTRYWKSLEKVERLNVPMSHHIWKKHLMAYWKFCIPTCYYNWLRMKCLCGNIEPLNSKKGTKAEKWKKMPYLTNILPGM